MGQRDHVRNVYDSGEMRAFMRALLNDVHALEKMLDAGLFEKGTRRIGAEQEMFLVDKDFFPAPISMEVLELINSDDIGTELARFNLEANVAPKVFTGRCLHEMEVDLDDAVRRAREAAASLGGDVVLAGILPTLDKSHLSLEYFSPHPRYFELNDAMLRQRGGDFQIHIKGLDELQLSHDNVLVESCNTSFQIHFQVGAEEFAPLYNLSQAITAPVLAGAVNSPVFFRHRLWKETRVAVFQHSVDARHEVHRHRGVQPRVDLGIDWVHESVLELIREDIARHRVLLVKGLEEDSLKTLAQGGIPKLGAMCLHNGTVYRWNRFCYGITDGKPHLRIENRALPSGPSVVDEMANAAFYFGLMAGLAEEFGDIRQVMTFDDVRSNFFAAARHGLKAQIAWEHGRTFTAENLILHELLPVAREGLRMNMIDGADIDRYLGIIEERVRQHRTGSRWVLDSLTAMGRRGTADLRYRTLTQAMIARQQTGEPVHKWDLASVDEAPDWRHSFLQVGQVMSTQLYTVRPGDLVEMAANLMDWNRIRYVPVEDDEGRLLGLVSYRSVLRLCARSATADITVREVMKTNLITVTPETSTIEAIRLVRRHQVGCLPVIQNDRLCGILTMGDFLPLYDKLIDDLLDEGSDRDD